MAATILEQAKARYEALKEAFETNCDKANEKLEEDPPISKSIKTAHSRMTASLSRVLIASENYVDLMVKAKPPPKDDIKALELERYDLEEKAEAIFLDMEEVLHEEKDDDKQQQTTQNHDGHHHRLPKLELPKFGGEARDWLQFWSSFKTIDEDNAIAPTHKFQYLLNCMTPGSIAEEILKSYPVTAANYGEAIQSLKERFGRDDMLVEVYVRDLIKLIMVNAQRKSDSSFSSLYVQLSSQLRSLGTLGVTTDKCAAILYPIVESTLPEDVFVAWERYRIQNEKTTKTSEAHLEQLMLFLKHEVEGTERIRLARDSFSTTAPLSNKQDKQRPKLALSTAANLVSTESKPNAGCSFCGGKHSSEACCKAMDMTLEERKALVKENRRCFYCLKPGHQSKACKATVKCVSCGSRHWAILCPELATKKKPEKDDKPEEKKTTKSVGMNNQISTADVLLQTIVVKIHGNKKSKLVRAMYDCGSSKSYVLKETADEVGLQKIDEENVVHLLFGGIKTKPQRHNRYKLHLSDVHSQFSCNFDVSDSEQITAPIITSTQGGWKEELKQMGIVINDHHTKKIEVLIGSDVYVRLLTGKKIDLDAGPSALETKLGWTISGKVYDKKTAKDVSSVFSFHMTDLNIKDLWDLDLIGIHEPVKDKSKQELQDAALEHFKKTVKRNPDGRYVVQLPWIEGHAPIPQYRAISAKKVESNKDRLSRQEVLQAYHEVFSSWEDEGIIQQVESNTGHYISHHGVIKPNSTTTPVRPVFNASFKTKGNPSLNDCLEVGPNMLELIPNIILRFCLEPVGITSDIKKAFLQIEVAEQDREFLKFHWYSDATFGKLQDFQHCRVVFGVSSSPFLLAAVLDHHLTNCDQKYVQTAMLLKKSFYVDNCVISLPTVEEATKFKNEAVILLQQAKMDLRGWEIDPSLEEKQVPILGLIWNTRSDVLQCDLRGTLSKLGNKPITKRKILSVTHSIFDPMGFVSPFTIIPKMLLQETCKVKAGWDTVLPESIHRKFTTWSDQIPNITLVKIPRYVAASQDKKTWSLHIFSDASGAAYSACAYLRSGQPGNVKIQLLMSRARVAPLKPTTIPRLELIGCLCGARLAKTIIQMIDFPEIPVYFSTDSSTALSWIQKDKNWSVFVTARVKEIRALTKTTDWRHVPGKQNPADIPTRGASIKHLLDISWWEGPEWLKEEERFWPTSAEVEDKEEVNQELRKTVISHINIASSDILSRLNRRSDFHMIVRVVAYIRRFLDYISKKHGQSKQEGKMVIGPISLEEFISAQKRIVQLVQKVHFSGAQDGKLKSLRTFEDSDGLIKLKTRLFRGEANEYTTPVILPHKDPMAAGAQSGVSFITAKCRRFRAKSVQVEEGPLPKDRVKVGPAFDVTGVDMAGPLFTKGNKKVWIALFTCANTRGVHLELCSGLTTEIFMSALRRFIARRGRPSIIYSDNGQNFVGTANCLKNVDWDKIREYATVSQILWKFNPPTASWWGGFWERMVGVVKQMLRAVLGSSRVNNEELQTLLCEVESVVNNRPLTYTTEDNEDLQPLTPNMFIRNCGVSILPDVDQVDRNHLVAQYRNLQNCRDELRNRFRKEYLAMLAHHGKNKKSREVTVGEVVLVGSDNQKRIDWPMGVIVELLPGSDHVRRVRVKTAKGILERPVQRLFPLEVSSKEDKS